MGGGGQASEMYGEGARRGVSPPLRSWLSGAWIPVSDDAAAEGSGLEPRANSLAEARDSTA